MTGSLLILQDIPNVVGHGISRSYRSRVSDREAAIELQTVSVESGTGGKSVPRLIASVHRKYQAPLGQLWMPRICIYI